MKNMIHHSTLAHNAFLLSETDNSLPPESLLSTHMISEYATSPDCIRKVLAILERLESEPHINKLKSVLTAGLERFGNHWRYADLTNVIWAVSKILQPQYYLEIGVRRGRSMAMVAATCSTCEIAGFDLWIDNYANVLNPGPDFVTSQLEQFNPNLRIELISGNSHASVPAYFQSHPDIYFDMITVDGDHSDEGARADLQDVLPRLKVGGILLFDDISHPEFPYLERVWHEEVASKKEFVSWQFTEAGNGVAFAIKKPKAIITDTGIKDSLQDAWQKVRSQLLSKGITRIALYGAGQHTHRFFRSADYSPLSILCVVDDHPQAAQMYNIPIIKPADIGTYPIQAILISTDSAAQTLAERAKQWAPTNVNIVWFYKKPCG